MSDGDRPVDLKQRWVTPPMDDEGIEAIRNSTCRQFAIMRPTRLATELMRVMADQLDGLPPHMVVELCFGFNSDADEVDAAVHLSFDDEYEAMNEGAGGDDE